MQYLPTLLLLLSVNFDEWAHELARKIVAAAGTREPITLSVRNLSSLMAVGEARQAIERQLRNQGVRFGDAGVELQVTLSENIQDYVWIAEVGGKVCLVSFPRSAVRPSSTFSLVISKDLLYEQDDPILDVAISGDQMLVLDPVRVSLHKSGQFLSLSHLRPRPRDVRGRLTIQGDLFRADLPGMVCHGALQPSFRLDCSPGDEPWLLPFGHANFSPWGNFFSGRSSLQKDLPAFFSAAPLGDLWIFTHVDGEARLYDRNLDPAGSIAGWGSDIAVIETSCSGSRQVLATRPADYTEPDAVQAYEITDRQAKAVSAPLEFPGPVTALWPSGKASAIAVSRDLKTGRYGAFRLSISCSM